MKLLFSLLYIELYIKYILHIATNYIINKMQKFVQKNRYFHIYEKYPVIALVENSCKFHGFNFARVSRSVTICEPLKLYDRYCALNIFTY